MVISYPIAGLLAAALGPTALYRAVPVSASPQATAAAALMAAAMILAVLVRRGTAAPRVPGLPPGRRR